MTPIQLDQRQRRSAALIALMAIEDEDDILRRHRRTCEGAPDRFTRYQDLAVKYTSILRAERDV